MEKNRYEIKAEDALPGMTLVEVAASPLPLPDRDTLDEREREIFDWVMDRMKRYYYSYPSTAGTEYRMTPLYQGLLQSPRCAEIVSTASDFYQTAEGRGSYSNRDRDFVQISYTPVLAEMMGKTSHLPIVAIADAVGSGIAPEDVKAILDGRLEDLAPEDRELVEYIQAVARGALTRRHFEGLKARMGPKAAMEYTCYITFKIGNQWTLMAMWGIQDKPNDSTPSFNLLQAYLDGEAEAHPADRGVSFVEPRDKVK